MVAIGVASQIQIQLKKHMIEGSRSKFMELKWVRRSSSSESSQFDRNLLRSAPGSLFPIYISTDPRHIDPHHLRDLYADCNHSCHRFPNHIHSHGRVEPVDIRKLRIALSHSAVLVSVFCKPQHVVAAHNGDDDGADCTSTANSPPSIMVMEDFFQSLTPVTPFNGQLVGFGRAISDCGLTASIYDVMVIPSLRRMGIGQMIVKKIVRMLTNRDIYDIAALCSENERLFLKACGFGDDILGSTTMMYTRTTSSLTQEGEQTITRAGRKLLLVPPSRDLTKLQGVEVCLISAHGLTHSTSLWKRQWFAVGWTDVNSKYCTKVDASGNKNPVWRTKFAIPVDDSASNMEDLTLNVEVYSIDPIFLTEKLHGSATVVLKEFLVKHVKNSDVSRKTHAEIRSYHAEIRSYRLRKKKSGKPRGFIDISIRISDEKKEPNSHSGSKGGIVLLDHGDDTHLATDGGLGKAYPQKQMSPRASFHWPEENHVQTNVPYSHSMPFPTTSYSDPYVGEPSHPAAAEPSYQPPRTITPPPPPPPSNVGYIPTFLPRNDALPQGYINMPSAGAAPIQRGPPGFAMGAGAAALAAGAVIFGDDFMSGFDAPRGIGDASLTTEEDPPF